MSKREKEKPLSLRILELESRRNKKERRRLIESTDGVGISKQGEIFYFYQNLLLLSVP